MKKRVPVMCTLVLAGALSSCAPSVTTASGQSYRPQVRVGSTAYFHEHVTLAQMTDQTPDDASVFLPGCSLAAVAARDVRVLGVDRATDICSETASNQVRGIGGFMVGLGAIAAIAVLPLIYFIIRVLSRIDAV